MEHNYVLSIAIMKVYTILAYRTAQSVMPSDYPTKAERSVDTVRKHIVKLE